jgi:hypothetical protein
MKCFPYLGAFHVLPIHPLIVLRLDARPALGIRSRRSGVDTTITWNDPEARLAVCREFRLNHGYGMCDETNIATKNLPLCVDQSETAAEWPLGT